MQNSKILYLAILVSFSLLLSIGMSYATTPINSNITSSPSAENITSSPSAESNLVRQNQLISNNTSIDRLQDHQSNDSLVNDKYIIMPIPLPSSTYNDAVLPKLYNSTANSVVGVSAFDSKNNSISKTGSGFINNYNGSYFIVTMSNLVTGNNNITVTLYDGSTYDSELVGYDAVANLAVLSADNINKSKLASLPLKNSTSLKVGQSVTTIGSTMDFTNIFTDGLISGLEKSIPIFGQNVSSLPTKIPNAIVTNLNLEPEFGGSPLLDAEGQVVGMNIENYSTTAANSRESDISFAIPSNSLIKIIPSLLSKGYYLHPWLGAAGADVTPDIAKALNLTEPRGFLVISVADLSPAKKAGILGGDNTTSINGRNITLGGDVILKVDDIEVQNIQDISRYIENEKKIGDTMVVNVIRNGLLQTINVKLDSNPAFLPPKDVDPPGSVSLTIPAGAAIPGNPPYTPTELSVKKGDVVNVVNSDNAPHTATNGKDASDPNVGKSFDTSLIMPGASATIDTSTMEAGEYPYHCTVHPFMQGTLTVTTDNT